MTHTNPLDDPQLYHNIDRSEEVPWTRKGVTVTRLRLLSDPGFPYWDVSYCHGEYEGRPVTVIVPFFQLTKGKVISEIIEWAKRDRVYAKGIGILDNISQLS